jgi:hypothetical protein
MYIKKLLNQKARELMSSTPQNVQKQTDEFIKVVSEAVNSYIRDADKKVEAMEAKSKTGSSSGPGEQYFLKDAKIGNIGLHPSLHRSTYPNKPMLCIHYQFDVGSPRYCSTSCAGFEILDNGDVKLCDGRIRCITN